jgi:hypothetical protein
MGVFGVYVHVSGSVFGCVSADVGLDVGGVWV